jgi:hypothetical protein
MNYQLSDHARTRMQQRAISPEALELVLEHGKTRYDHRGARVVFLPKQLRKRLLTVLAPESRRRLEKQLRTYLVCAAEGARIFTVGHRHQRMPGH